MMKRIFGELPTWMTLQNPLLRYEITRHRDKSESRLKRMLTWVVGLTIFILVGYIYATDGLQRGLQLPYTLDIWRIIIFPLLLMQVIMRVAGLSMGVGAVTDERQRQTWDNLRATERGAEIGLRTRLVSVFYRLRGFVFTIMLARLVLIGAILYELTSIQGDYLNLLTASAVPSVSMEVGVILLSAFMTAFILMPISAIGLDIAIGLFIATNVRQRAISGMLQVLVIVFRVVSSGLLFWWTWQFINDELVIEGQSAFALLTSFSILGDWGVVLSQLSQAGRLWSQVPNSIFIGILMLGFVVLQVALMSGLLMLAVRAAETRE